MSNEIVPLMSIQNDVEEIFYDESFMLVLERNLPLIRETSIKRPVDINVALKFKGNLDGLLLTLDIDHDLIWLVMRLNGYRNCYDFNGRMESLLIPSESTVSMLKDRHTQIQKMI